jgi:hypothetical protein
LRDKPIQSIYGPIPSRRLGQSLGIDPVPLKTCNWNCVYCQLGRTQPLLHERREYVEAEAIDPADPAALETAASHIGSFFAGGETPPDIAAAVTAAYAALNDALLAVRSSATAEDLPGASFAGQQETYLNIRKGVERIASGIAGCGAWRTGGLLIILDGFAITGSPADSAEESMLQIY